MPSPTDNDFLTAEEAAELTGYSLATIRKYAHLRLIPYYQRKPHTQRLFRRADLLAWASPKRVAATRTDRKGGE